MLQVQSRKQLEEAESKEMAENESSGSVVLDKLSAAVRDAFQEALQIRTTNGVTARINKSRRLKSGLYDQAILDAIIAKGGSQLFFNITETKCESFQAWLEDVFAPAGDRAWDATPTTIPNLPDDMAATVQDQAVQYFSAQSQANGGMLPDPDEVIQFTNDLYDETMKAMIEDAKERCQRMVSKMEDQTEDGGWNEAITDFFADLSVYPTAILKGPVMKQVKQLDWVNDEVKVIETIIPTWECVDPFCFYPGPNARNVNESYLCEVIDFDKKALSDMRGLPGWNKENIDKVLSLSSTGSSFADMFLDGETENLTMQDKREDLNAGLVDSTIRAIEYWGSQRGEDLKDWGMKGITDDNKYYEVQCVLIGTVVVKAILNPDPLDRRPYYANSYIKNKKSLWGIKSIPEKMEDCQEGMNGSQRNLMNNLALSSGPMMAVDIDVIPASHLAHANEVAPWKCWQFHGNKMKRASGDPVKFFQPQSNSGELIQVSEYYKNESDDRTMIPRYISGDKDMGGAGQTASGLSMMMSAASRGIKRVVRNIDKYVFKPAIERLYVMNMLDKTIDKSMKGDAQIIPRGALAQMVKEQTQLRRQEFLNMTNNPTDLAITGMEGRATVLRAVAEGLDLPVDKVMPSEEDLRRASQNMINQQQPPVTGPLNEPQPQQQVMQ